MRKPVKKTSFSDETGELNVQQPEQPESSRPNRVRKSEQRGSGKEMASSYHHPKRGGQKIKVGTNDRKIQLDESLRELIREQIRTRAELVEENERLNAFVQLILREILRELKLEENGPTHVDSPKDMGSPEDRMDIDPPEGKEVTLPYFLTQTEVSESEINQYMNEMRATNKELEMDKARLNAKQTAYAESLKILKKINEPMENNVSDACYFAPKIVLGKLPMAVDGTSTCRPTSSTVSSSFISIICKFILQFANQIHLLSTAGDAESRKATHDEQASTSALGIKGTTDVRELEKRMENNVSDACYFALRIVVGKLPTPVDGTFTSRPTSSFFSNDFISDICKLIRLVATLNHLLSTAGDAESREATHDAQASTLALGMKCMTDVQELEKRMEHSVSQAYYFALEIAKAEEEDGENQAVETADSNN